MVSKTITIKNKLGLHARASSKLAELSNQYDCDLTIIKDNKTANTKSIMGVMMLAASVGSMVTINACGEDEDQALQAIVELFENKFGEIE